MRKTIHAKVVGPKSRRVEANFVPMSFKVSPEIKLGIELAAGRADRSQSEEVARRLRHSFEWQPVIDLIEAIENTTGKGWREDSMTCDMVIFVVTSHFRAFGGTMPASGFSGRIDPEHLLQWSGNLLQSILPAQQTGEHA